MRVKIGVKESSKKKLMRNTNAGHVDKMGDKTTGKESRHPDSREVWRRGRRPKLRWGITLKVT